MFGLNWCLSIPRQSAYKKIISIVYVFVVHEYKIIQEQIKQTEQKQYYNTNEQNHCMRTACYETENRWREISLQNSPVKA